MRMDLLEVTFYGRGGQGAVTAAQVMAIAGIRKGLFALAYPEFGPERRGAPVRAYLRLAKEPYFVREPIEQPDIAVILDKKLLEVFDIISSTKACIVLNSTNSEDAEELAKKYPGRVVWVDAYSIAMRHLGRPIVNTTMLGALLKVVDVLDVDSVSQVLMEIFGEKLGPKNVAAMKEAYEVARVVK